MYAVIETGGKQYRVEVGTELEIELLKANAGETVAFDRVLLIADGESASIGTPVVANGSVAGEIIRRDRGEKLISFKYRPKARRRVKKGHRQELTLLRISDIVLDGQSAAADVEKAEEARRRERAKMEEAAKRQAAADAELAAKLAAEKPVKTEAKPARARTAKAAADSKPDTAKKSDSKAAKADAKPAKADAKPAKATADAKAGKPAAKKADAKAAPKRSTKKDA
jgi:large subunit ribosomal protein L21